LLLFFFQLLIITTGNYGFFNVLTIVLLVPLLDDRQLLFLKDHLPAAAPVGGEYATMTVSVIFVLFLILNFCQLIRLVYRPSWLSRLLAALSPFMVSNSYGLFAVMTTNRYEFIIEGSNDLREWRSYEFHWKPGNPACPPRQAAPHQPRLDWQMWFAALDPRTIEPWLGNLVVRLLEGAPPVLALFKHNPFPDAPPSNIRLTVYRYHFTSVGVRRKEKRWWERTMIGRFQPMTLMDM
jgi:hypothetical protein